MLNLMGWGLGIQRSILLQKLPLRKRSLVRIFPGYRLFVRGGLPIQHFARTRVREGVDVTAVVSRSFIFSISGVRSTVYSRYGL